MPCYARRVCSLPFSSSVSSSRLVYPPSIVYTTSFFCFLPSTYTRVRSTPTQNARNIVDDSKDYSRTYNVVRKSVFAVVVVGGGGIGVGDGVIRITRHARPLTTQNVVLDKVLLSSLCFCFCQSEFLFAHAASAASAAADVRFFFLFPFLVPFSLTLRFSRQSVIAVDIVVCCHFHRHAVDNAIALV